MNIDVFHRCRPGIVLTLFLGYATVAEDRLKDFQAAVNHLQDEKACLSIPYADLQFTCERNEKEVNRLCNDSGKACRDARASFQSAFNDAKSRAAGETDPDIKPLADRLIRSWQDREHAHVYRFR